MVRKPAVAGAFYDAVPERLARQVSELMEGHQERAKALGIVSPHAGLVYSGGVAGAVYSRAEIPGTVVLLGPNHTGYGADASIMAGGGWEMPWGRVEIDSALAGRLMELAPSLSEDHSAHVEEHSLEVQLPFIRYFRDDFRILPIVLMRLTLEQCEELGRALADSIREARGGALMVASTDMSHYENQKAAERKDRIAIDRILALDHAGLYETVRREGITMCGFIPTTVMLSACKELGATGASLVKYQTSGDVSGNYDEVVGYAGLLIR